MWETGYIDFGGQTYYWEAKVFDVGSQFGINSGRISKLSISKLREDGKWDLMVNYDRGWDIRPAGRNVKNVYSKILKMFA